MEENLIVNQCFKKPHTETSSLRTLKIMRRNLNDIVRSWIRFQYSMRCTVRSHLCYRLESTQSPRDNAESKYRNIFSWRANYRANTCTLYGAGIFKQSKGARNRVRIGLSYRTARLHRLVEFIPWNRFLGPIKVWKFGLSCHILLVHPCLLVTRAWEFRWIVQVLYLCR